MERQTQPNDDQIPALELLFSEEQLTNLFNTHLPFEDIISIHREYLRYKPESSCLLLYRVQTQDQTHLIYVKAFSDLAKAIKTSNKQSKLSLATTHSHVVSEHQLILNRYPYDDKLPSLEKLSNPKQRLSVINRAMFDKNHDLESQLTVLQYKPERRFVAKLTFSGGSIAVVKTYTQERYDTLSYLYLKKEQSPFGRLLGKSDKHCLLIYQWIEGNPLAMQTPILHDDLLCYQRCGEELARFHQQPPSKKVKPIRTKQFLHLLHLHSQSIAQILPEQTALTTHIADTLSALIKALPKERSFIHGDFYADQVLVNSESIEFLDFDNLCTWFSGFDVGNFLSHLSYRMTLGLITRNEYEQLEAQFLAGYRESTSIDDNKMHLFTALGIFQLIYHPLRFGIIDWKKGICALLSRCCYHLDQVQTSEAQITIDQSLPQLTKLIDPSFVQSLIEHQCPTQGSPLANLQIEQAILIRSKLGKRALIEYQVNTENQPNMIGKVRTKGFDRKSWKTQNTLYSSEFNPKASDNVQVPKPLFKLPEQSMWIQEKVPGTTIFEPFCNSANKALSHQLAFALYKLHNSTLNLEKTHTLEKELSILERNLLEVAERNPQWQTRIKRILAWCRTVSETLSDSIQKPIHRDFYHDQVLVHKHTLYLLDFDLCCMGNPYLDLGNFIAHIQEQCLRFYNDADYAERTIECFTSRYLLLSGNSNKVHDIDVYRVLSLARHIAISQRIPSRKKYTLDIISLVEQELRKTLL